MAPQVEPPVYSQEIARIDDFIIKEDVLRFRLRLEMDKYPEEFFQNDGKKEAVKGLLQTVLDKMIMDYTVIAYGQKKKLTLSAEELNKRLEERKKQWNPKAFENYLNEKNIPYSRWKQLVEDEIKVKYIMDKELASGLNVSPAEINNYFRKNQKDFKVLERVRVRQIVTDSLDKANDLHARLLDGANFAKLAVHHSLSPDRARGGDLGYFAKGTFPKEFDEYCFKLKKGEVSPVVKSDYGYHIFKLLDRKPPGKKTLAEVAPQIQQLLFEEKLKKKYDVWIAKVRAGVSVILHKDILDNFIL